MAGFLNPFTNHGDRPNWARASIRHLSSPFRFRIAIAVLSLLALSTGLALPAQGTEPRVESFRRAEGRRDWQFPRDHGQHPTYRLEWWYYTGILTAEQGRTFGYQLTFFRQGLAPRAPRRPSAWAVQSLYLAHTALSDVGASRFLRDERVSRDSLGLAGSAPDRHRVWLGPWRAEPLKDDPHGVTLSVPAGAFALELTLRPEKPPVLHGQGGLDAKGSQSGQASWYYSLPRLATTGWVTVDGKRQEVRGQSWMDHEFGSGQLAPELVGWDWLALRLDDGSDLMLYRLRTKDGTSAASSGGSLIAPDGTSTPLRLTDGRGEGSDIRDDVVGEDTLHMLPGRTWESPVTGGVYPVVWRVEWPGQRMVLRVEPVFDAQENPPGPGTPFAYWEGMVRARGRRGQTPLIGEGYLELTGYAGELGGALRDESHQAP